MCRCEVSVGGCGEKAWEGVWRKVEGRVCEDVGVLDVRMWGVGVRCGVV